MKKGLFDGGVSGNAVGTTGSVNIRMDSYMVPHTKPSINPTYKQQVPNEETGSRGHLEVSN